MFTKFDKPINQAPLPLNLSTHWPQKQCLRFLADPFVIFLHEDKVSGERKIELPVKKRHNFFNDGSNQNSRIMFCRQIFWQHSVQISANLVQELSTWSSNCTWTRRDFLLSRNREKIEFGGIQVWTEYHSKGDTAAGSAFYQLDYQRVISMESTIAS